MWDPLTPNRDNLKRWSQWQCSSDLVPLHAPTLYHSRKPSSKDQFLHLPCFTHATGMTVNRNKETRWSRYQRAPTDLIDISNIICGSSIHSSRDDVAKKSLLKNDMQAPSWQMSSSFFFNQTFGRILCPAVSRPQLSRFNLIGKSFWFKIEETVSLIISWKANKWTVIVHLCVFWQSLQVLTRN